MKNFYAVLALLIQFNIVSATDYYFSTSTGNDSRSSSEAQNPATPWKTVQKLNEFFPHLQPGDKVYFKRGEVFNGTINIGRSGNSGAPITIGAYGTGSKPVINGLTAIANWVNLGNGIWEGVSSSTKGSAVASSTAAPTTTDIAAIATSIDGATTAAGLSYKYYEGKWDKIPDFGGLSPKATGTSGNISLEPRKNTDDYAFLWEGKITIPAAGTYYFETTSDDGSKLYIGNYGHYITPVVDNDGLHGEQTKGGYYTFPSAGTYDIAISFFERDGGETMRVYWGNTQAGIALHTPIPDAAFSSNTSTIDISSDERRTGNGLTYKYYEGKWDKIPDFGGLRAKATGALTNVSIAPRQQNDDYAFLWEGKITIPKAGQYYFETTSDDGSKLYIGKYGHFITPVVDNDGLHGEQTKGGYYTFPSAGTYDIAISFFERDGGETIRVYWGNTQAGIALHTPIPDAAFQGGTTTTPTPTPDPAPPAPTPDPAPPTPTPDPAPPTPTPDPAPSNGADVESIPLGSIVNMLVINKEPRAMGRYPNTGYLTLQSHSGHHQINSNQLSGYPNWTGGEVVIRKNRYVIDRQKITSHSGGTLNFVGTHIEAHDNFGFFIQNHPQTLDQFGEWYYDPNSKKVRVFFGSENPNNYDVRATAADVLLTSFSYSYITFDNISFQGSNRLGLDVRYAQNVVLNNCEVLFSGEDAIAVENMRNFKLENSKVENTNNIGFRTLGSTATEIRRNIFNNTATMAGMGKSIGGYTGMELYGDNIVIANNTITNTGYNGISFQGNNVSIENNLIDRFGFVKDDGGAIYSYRASSGSGAYGRKIRGNIILRGIGAGEGTNSPSWKPMYGFFMDDMANNVEITDNTVTESGAGIFVHNAENIVLNNNTFYNNVKQLYVTTDQVVAGAATRNVTITNNLLVAKHTEQRTGEFASSFNDIGQFGHFDNNVYAKPIDDNKSMFVAYDQNRFYQNIDLPTWKGMFGKDANSRRSPLQLPAGSNPDEYIRFEYNASSSSRTISLGSTYMDVRGTSYSGDVTLQPYTSLVLIRTNGAIRVASPSATVATSSIGSVTETAGMKVFPNPAKSHVEVSLQLPQVNNQRVSLAIQSASGATVRSMPVTVTSGMITKIDVSTFSPGVYIINVISNGKVVATKKFVKL